MRSIKGLFWLVIAAIVVVFLWCWLGFLWIINHLMTGSQAVIDWLFCKLLGEFDE